MEFLSWGNKKTTAKDQLNVVTVMLFIYFWMDVIMTQLDTMQINTDFQRTMLLNNAQLH